MEVESKPEWMPENPHDPSIFSRAHGFFIEDEEYAAFNEGCQQTARKIFVWLNSDCVESHSDGFNRTRKDCKFCMQEYCKEVGL